MSNEQNRLLLLSSDIRRRYAEDILTALALPPGATIQFRYGAEYVVSALQRSVANGSIVSAQAILAFVGDAESEQPFVLPVRFATVMQAVCLADIFTFKLRIGSYVDLDQYGLTVEDVSAVSKIFLSKVGSANGKFYPALSTFPDMHLEEAVDAPQHWLGAARRLSMHETFKYSYFMRIDTPVTQDGRALEFNKDGRLQVVDQQSVRIPTSFYAERYEPLAKPMLSCSTDGTFLRVSSDEQYEISHRYDSIEFWLHPAALSFDALSRVTISLSSQTSRDQLLPAHARLPVVVRRSKSRLLARVVTTAFGALLVALPAILGSGSPLQVRILSAVLGAALLAIAAVVLGSAK